MLFSLTARAQQSFNSLNVKELGANRLIVTSTTQGSKPCPVMSEAQRDALTALVGQCVYNSDALQLNIYNGSDWQSAGGGGIDNWVTANDYDIGAVVIESNKIYQCNTAHTSTVFSSQLSNWTQLSNNVSDVTGTLPIANGGTNSTTALSGSSIIVSNGTQIVQGDAGTSTTVLHGNASGAPTYGAVALTSDVSGVLPLANGGTNKNATANNGAIAYSDADSLELLAPGTSGQILQTNGAGAPSFVDKSISGKAQQTTAVTLKEIQVYNNQLTDMTSGKYLFEGGNNNLLKDPSFEGDIATTPWTGPNGIGTTFAIHGAQHGSRNYTAAQVNIYQDSTTNNGAFVDKTQQGLAMIYVKTNSDVNNVYVCQRLAGVLVASSDGTKITNCAPVPNDAKWNLIKLYVNLGTTSNGIAVVSLNPATAALQNMTGYVDVDGAFLGLADRQELINITPWQSYTPTFTGFGTPTSVSFKWRQVGDSIQVEGTYVTGTVSATVGSISLPNSYTLDTNKITIANTTASAGQAVGQYRSTGANLFGHIVTATGTSTSLLYFANVISNATDSLVPSAGNASLQASRSMSVNFQVPISSLGATTPVISSQSQDTDWASCGHTTSDFTGFGTVSSIETFCKREGGDLLMRGKFVSGTSTGVEARINLKLNGVTLTSAPVATIPTIQDVGRGTRNFSSANTYAWVTLIEPSVTYFTIGIQANATNGLTKQTGSSVMSSGEVFAFHTRIPIAGWQTNMIFGSFNEVVTTPGVSKPRMITAYVAPSCTSTPCTIATGNGFSSITRSSTGTYTGNFTSTFSAIPVCTMSGGQNFIHDTTTTSAVTFRTFNNAAVLADSSINIICHGIAP